MKRTVLLLIPIVLLAPVVRAEVTLVFDPDQLIQSVAANSTDLKAVQADARRIHFQWGTDYYGTFSDAMQAGHTQPGDYNTYVGWRDSLTDSGDGIAVFNSWFLNGGAAQSWGETVVIRPDSVISGTAADGWNLAVFESPYGPGWEGWVIQWYTLDPAKRINMNSDIDDFSLTADLYWDADADGWDEDDMPVAAGDEVRFWVGNLNGDDAGFYRTDTQALYFDNAVYGYSAGDQGSGFEAAITSTATAIPAPGALLLGTIGVALTGWLRRRNKL